MAVDEFGREILTGRGRRGDRSPSPYGGGGGGGGDGDPSYLHEALPTSRYGGETAGGPRNSSSSHSNRHSHPPGSTSNSHHHHSSSNHNYNHNNRHHYHLHDGSGGGGGGGGGGSYPYHGSQRHSNYSHHNPHHGYNSSNNNNSNNNAMISRKRKHGRDDSPGPHSNSNNRNHHPHHHHHKPSQEPHPSTLYAEDPMLCQYLWVDSQGGNAEFRDDDDDEDDEENNAHDNTDDKDENSTPRMIKTEEGGGGDEQVVVKEELEVKTDPEGTIKEEEDEDDVENAATTTQNNNNNKKKKKLDEKISRAYNEYRQSYCLNYIRTFFNQHMDDSWFRNLYSPLGQYRSVGLLDRQRAHYEATDFAQELQTSLSKNMDTGRCFFVLKARLSGGIKTSSSSSSTPYNDYHHHHTHTSSLIHPSTTTSTTTTSPSSKSLRSTTMTATSSLSNPVPGTHVLTLANKVLPILDVPPYVTDEQLTLALLAILKPTSTLKPADLQVIYSSSVKTMDAGGSTSSSLSSSSAATAPLTPLYRTAYLKCTDEVRKELIQQLILIDRGGGPNATSLSSSDGTAGATHVPRKEDTHVPKKLELEVECSDAYGRSELDIDGKGGETASGNNSSSGGGGGTGGGAGGGPAAEDTAIPTRKATVWVSTLPLVPHVAVLSAAVSSKERIAQDSQYARDLAKAYDIRKGIPVECQLETLLPQAIPGFQNNQNTTDCSPSSPSFQDLEDALDLAIAYLRRVHLFSFYNGCVASDNVADVLNGTHPASTIHLRLGIADELLQQAEEKKKEAEATAAANTVIVSDQTTTTAADGTDGGGEGTATTTTTTVSSSSPTKPAEPPKKDLLVQRLDMAIEKALSQTKEWLENPETWSQVIISPEIDAVAKAIEDAELHVEPTWIQDHALIDEDGRARCSFHFCRKLFKDSSFLKKHLIKKHSEFLRAEIAKCHDQAMMAAWDAQEYRACVPPILVDCGRNFSLVPSPVIGAAVPLAEDPEPELWRRQEEARRQVQAEEQARRERYEQQQQQQQNYPKRDFRPAPDLNGPLSEERSQPHVTSSSAMFVDVDDMKEEKVELAFDNIEVPVVPPKKKKKKRKLL